MGHSQGSWRDQTRSFLGNVGQTVIVDSDIDTCVKAAVRRYSADAPQIVYQDYVGNGTTFDLALPTGWVSSFSSVQAVEFPFGNRPATYLDLNEVSLYPPTSAPTVIRLNMTTPGNGQTARVSYTVPWPLPDPNASTDQIADTDFEAVCELACFYVCTELASRAASNVNQALPGASIAYTQSEEDRWLKIGDGHRKRYTDHLGGSDDEIGPASSVGDTHASSSFLWAGKSFLFHDRRPTQE